MDKLIHEKTPFGRLEVISLDELKRILDEGGDTFISVHKDEKQFGIEYLKAVNYKDENEESRENGIIVEGGKFYSFKDKIGFYFKRA